MACVVCSGKINILESVRFLNDNDFSLVYAQQDGMYIGNVYNYGFRLKNEAFYILNNDLTLNIYETPLISEVANETSSE